MYEGCLRWSDLHQLTFGSCTLTPLHMCICITAAKNDRFHQGQWVTVPFSSDPISSFALFVKVRDKLIKIWNQSSTPARKTILGPTWRLPLPHLFPLEHIPLLISINPTSNLPCCTPQVPYHSFLATLKIWTKPLGFESKDIGTHSLRRGLSSDWALLGIPPHIRQMHGRWRSPQIADSYIGTETQGDLSLMAFHKARGTPFSLLATDM